MKIGILILEKPLEGMQELKGQTNTFIDYLAGHLKTPIIELDEDNYGTVDLPIVFIRTGGVEGEFKRIYPKLEPPFFLLCADSYNALPAALEIASFVRNDGKKAELVHGEEIYVLNRIKELSTIYSVRKRIRQSRLATIGSPSDWLISSDVDREQVYRKLGITIVDIPYQEVKEHFMNTKAVSSQIYHHMLERGVEEQALMGSMKLYEALKEIVEKYNLNGFTFSGFDFLEEFGVSDSLALSLLNTPQLVAGSEGDLSSLLSMYLLKELTGQLIFEGNPSKLVVTNNELVLSHCTLPFEMAREKEFLTHFESGKSIGIRGAFRLGRGTLFKLSGDLKRYFISGVDIVENMQEPNMCRTQVKLHLDLPISYFLSQNIGNHHVLCYQDFSHLLEQFMKGMDF